MHHHTKLGSKLKGSALQKIASEHIHWHFEVLMRTLNEAIQVLHMTLWLVMMYHQTKFGIKRDQQFIRYSRNCRILIMSPCCNLILMIANQSFCMTLWSMMMHHKTKHGHHKTKHGHKLFRNLEDIIWTFTDVLNLRCDIDFECSSLFSFFFLTRSTLI